jgi:UDP-2,3-diacylglucosamine pyrophosphatase LpxH
MKKLEKKKNFNFKYGYLAALGFAAVCMSCSSSSDSSDSSTNPFDTMSDSGNKDRDKIVVISDLHLGNDLSYSENVKHLPRLEQFLKEIRSSNTVSELVLGGDIFDEWYIPTRTNTYGGGAQADFIRKTVKANQAIFDALNSIIKDGKIKVTYVPGNHDMGITPENVDLAMPGVNQARDSKEKYGIGRYSPAKYSQIFIEHGHRYDFFSCLTPNANDDTAPGALLPPGYFFARIAANSFTNPTTIANATKMKSAVLGDATNDEQQNKFLYYKIWKQVMDSLIYVKDNFDDPIITTLIGNFTKTYTINDVLPRNGANNTIEMNLYNNIFTQASWDAREVYNGAPVLSKIREAIYGSLETSFIDKQSYVQYFNNSDSPARIVIFGHTHIPMIKTYTNTSGKPCIYANSGTWEDQKTRDKNAVIDQDALKMHFVVIAPEKTNAKKMQVSLWQFKHGKHTLEAKTSVEL